MNTLCNRLSFFEYKFSIFGLVFASLIVSTLELLSLSLTSPSSITFWFLGVFYVFTAQLTGTESKDSRFIALHVGVVVLVGFSHFFINYFQFQLLLLCYGFIYLVGISRLIITSPKWLARSRESNYVVVLFFFIAIYYLIHSLYLAFDYFEIAYSVKRNFFHYFILVNSIVCTLTFLYISDFRYSLSNSALAHEIISNNSSFLVNNYQDECRQAKIDKILDFFQFNTGYLNCDFTIDDLALATDMSRVDVSEVINQNLDSSFYKIIAKYRIEYAKTLLINFHNLTIEAIMEESGFGSKSSFNKYFKLYVGQTPSMFRNQMEQ